MVFLLFLLFSIIYLNSISAQIDSTDYSIQHFTIADGLKQMQVDDIHVDRNGLMWLGTRAGVCTFDGESFDSFDDFDVKPSSVEDIDELSDGTICLLSGTHLYIDRVTHFDTILLDDRVKVVSGSKLAIDWKDRIWIYTSLGKETICYDERFMRFHEVFPSFEGEDVMSVIPDNKNEIIYLFTRSNQVIRYDHGSLDTIFSTDEVLLARSSLDRLDQFNKPGIPIFTRKSRVASLFFYNSSDETVDTVGVVNPLSLANSNLLPDGYYRRFNDSLRVFKEGQWVTLIEEIKKNYNWFHCAIPDKHLPDRYLIGTDKGLIIADRSRFTSYSEDDYPYVWAVSEDKDNNIILGSYGSGLYEINSPSPNIDRIVDESRVDYLKNCIYFGMSKSKSGGLYVPYQAGLLYYEDNQISHVYPVGDSVSYNPLLYTYADHDEGLILIANCPGIEIIDTSYHLVKKIEDLGFKHKCLLTIVKDQNGAYWFGGGGGICRYDLVSDSLTTYTDKSHQLSTQGAVCSLVDEDGDIWFGSKHGLTRYVPEQDTFQYFHQFANTSVSSIIQIESDKCFLGTLNGLVMADLMSLKKTGNLRSRLYSVSEGFTGMECGQNGFYKDSKGQVWITTSTDLISFDPNVLDYDISPLLITVKTVNQKRVKAEEKLDLPYGINDVNIKVGLSVYHSKRRVLYRYKLNRNIWTAWISETQIVLNDLSSGNHSLTIQGKYEFDDNVAEMNYEFEVSQPFYAEPYFYTLAFGLLAILFAVLFWVYANRLKIIKQKEKLAIEKKELIGERKELIVENEELIEEREELIDEKEELSFAIDEIKQINAQLTAYNKKLLASTNLPSQEVIIIKAVNKVHKVKLANILSIVAEDSGVRFNLDGNSMWIDKSLTNLIDQLPKENFVRIHRSTIINIEQIKWINSKSLELVDGSHHKIGRTYKSSIQNILK